MAKIYQLLNTPRDVLQLILEELYQSDKRGFSNFRLASTTCRREADLLLFKDVTLHDRTPGAKSRSSAVIERLLNADDDINFGVKKLTIGPVSNPEWFYLEILPSLRDIINNIPNLQCLEWQTHHATGSSYHKGSTEPNILEALRLKHPTAKLNVLYYNRGYIQLDQGLLSSPNLYALDIDVYYDNDPVYGRNEMQLVKDLLIKGNSVKSLHLSFKNAGLPYQPDADDPRIGFGDWKGVLGGPLNFHWQNVKRFPSLEDLKVEYSPFQFTSDNCVRWAKVMDWSNLKKLDLWKGAPKYLLEALTNRVPNLTFLRFGISLTRSWDMTSENTDLPILSNFFSSISRLRELHFGADSNEDLALPLQVMLHHQGNRLERLEIVAQVYGMKDWYRPQYLDVLEQAPKLKYFKALVKEGFLEGTWHGESHNVWSAMQKFESATKSNILEAEPKRTKRGKIKGPAGRRDNERSDIPWFPL